MSDTFEKNKELAASLYRDILRREIDEETKHYWANEIESSSFEAVYVRLSNSDEAKGLKSSERNGVKLFVRPGHFYSPIVDPREIEDRENHIFINNKHLHGIHLNEQKQILFTEILKRHNGKISFHKNKTDGHRYYYENSAFGTADAVVFSTMILHCKPRRIIEVGSGYSSAIAIDTLNTKIHTPEKITFIEPYPALVETLVPDASEFGVEIIPTPVQQAPLSVFDELEPNDILFIDSTHIVKTGSDVIFEVEEILPRLRPGVIIHFHDVFYPFEYPKEWAIDENRSWNELYYLRVFLSNNPEYEIIFWNDFMEKRHGETVRAASPIWAEVGGSSLWLRKLAKPTLFQRAKRRLGFSG